jgi:hypothetical protein
MRLIASLEDSMNAKKMDQALLNRWHAREKFFSYSMIGSITTLKSSKDRPRSSARSRPGFRLQHTA